jgi:hypothetical protein
LRLANTLMMIIIASTATTTTLIMIFFFRVKAITCSLVQGISFVQFNQSVEFARKSGHFETKLIRVTLTSKKRKQFQ